MTNTPCTPASDDSSGGTPKESDNTAKLKKRIARDAEALRYTLRLLVACRYVEPRKMRRVVRIIAGGR